MLIPIGTDAPIYHWPKATVGLIILNIVLLIAIPPSSSAEDAENDDVEVAVVPRQTLFERGALSFGDDLHPLQWCTHFFLHIGYGHLIGNMIFLWAFGIVVEGKLGVLRFLAVYVAIGILSGALDQVLFLWSGFHGVAVGASAVVFGLMAICMFWAPVNEMSCIFIFGFGFRMWVKQVELRYTWVALLYIGEQILSFLLTRLREAPPITELGHLDGALWGGILAYVMLKNEWVDCEGWDLFTQWNKRRKLSKDWKLREERLDRANLSERRPRKQRRVDEAAADEVSVEDRSAKALNKVRKLIEMEDFTSAVAAYDKAARAIPSWPNGPELLEMIKGMHSRKAEVDSLPLMKDYCRKYPESAARMQLKMAQVLIRDKERPTHGLRVLQSISEAALPANLRPIREQLMRRAEAMQDDGVLELEEDL